MKCISGAEIRVESTYHRNSDKELPEMPWVSFFLPDLNFRINLSNS